MTIKSIIAAGAAGAISLIAVALPMAANAQGLFSDIVNGPADQGLFGGIVNGYGYGYGGYGGYGGSSYCLSYGYGCVQTPVVDQTHMGMGYGPNTYNYGYGGHNYNTYYPPQNYYQPSYQPVDQPLYYNQSRYSYPNYYTYPDYSYNYGSPVVMVNSGYGGYYWGY